MSILRKIIKNLPIIKQLNNKFWEIKNKLNENIDINLQNNNYIQQINNIVNENNKLLLGMNHLVIENNKLALNINHITIENSKLIQENNNYIKEINQLTKMNKDLAQEIKNLTQENNNLQTEDIYKVNTLLSISNKTKKNEISVLCDLYGSDKGSLFRNVHTYTDLYQELFYPIKDNVKAVLESGIGRINPSVKNNLSFYPNPGASLKVWRDYFTNAVIIGGDINYEALKETEYNEERIYTGFLDQMSPLVIKRFFEYFVSKYTDSFDIIIDNGLHTAEAAICLFENTIRYLKKDGFYIIEDMHTVKDIPVLKEYFNNCELKDKINVKYELLDKVSLDNDNNLVIISNK